MVVLLSTKLRKPYVTPHYLERPRLRQLLKGIDHVKLTTVVASPGSGKSMLVASYFDDLAKPLIWLNLSADCNDATLFWSYLLEGFRPFLRWEATVDFELVQRQFSQLDIREWLAVVINQLQDGPVYVVLDDVHLLQDQRLLADIEYFVEALPESIHLILLSRQAIPFYLAQWQMAHQLLEIKQEMLAFTEGEAMQFIETVNQQLTPEVKQDYWAFSEGWIGGLQLLLADSGTTSQGLMVTGDKGLVYDYLRREMYQALPKELQSFLVVTAQFSYVNQELAERLFPQRRFEDWLEQLERYHILIQIVDHQQQFYRYHHLFEEFLLQQVPPSKQVLREGVAVFAEIEDLDEAIKLALKIADYEVAMALILALEQPIKMLFFMNQVPNSAAITNFDFTLQKFFFHYTNSELAEGQSLYQLAIKQIPHNPDFQLFHGMEYLIGERQVVFEMATLGSQQIQQLQASETTKALMMIKDVTVLFHQCRYREGLEQIRYNQELMKELKSDYLTFYNLTIEAQLLEEIGHFKECLYVYKKIEILLEESNSLSRMSPFFNLSYHISITGTYLKQLDLVKAKQELDDVSQLAATAVHEEAYLYNRVEYWYLNGELELAWEGLSQLLQTDIFGELLSIASLLSYALEAKQLSHQFQQAFKEKYEASDGYLRGAQFLYLRILQKEGRAEEADYLIETTLLASRKGQIPLMVVEGNLVKIRGLLGKPERLKEAQDLYREAVYYACDDNIRQPFYLERATLKGLFQENYQLIQQSFEGVEANFHQTIVDSWELVSSHTLTEREAEVLVEIAKGFSTKEIAKVLFISEATVKTHILNIYRKFAVNSRVAAVEKGQQVGILSISN